MKTSTDRILTTHTGSLPKPASLVELLERRDQVGLSDDDAQRLRKEVARAVADVVDAQVRAGVDLVNDGEASKVSYATYVKERIHGFGGDGRRPFSPEFTEFGEHFARTIGDGLGVELPACDDDVGWIGAEALDDDIGNLRSALDGRVVMDAFMTAASPGCIALHLDNVHYPTYEEYLFALADVMKVEYDAIHAAGFVLQLDCPDLAMGRHLPHFEMSLAEFRDQAKLHVEAMNHALRDIPADALRMHLCWGNYEGPHVLDVPIADVLDVVLAARPAAVCYEAANPRHGHEWKVFRDVELPEGKVLVPGVVDSTTNFVEHPELVAERIVRLAEIVGRERVMAGTDCGFSTFTKFKWVDPKIVWRKLEALSEGARLATEELWS